MIRGLHHNAYRCRDSEETRRFYEDFLGLPLVNAFRIETLDELIHAFKRAEVDRVAVDRTATGRRPIT